MPVDVARWPGERPPTEDELLQLYRREGLHPYSWSNAPGDVYSAHSHAYHKVLYCLRGSITFGLPDEHSSVTLEAGDRLDLPPGVVHDALVGPAGVVCLEAHR